MFKIALIMLIGSHLTVASGHSPRTLFGVAYDDAVQVASSRAIDTAICSSRPFECRDCRTIQLCRGNKPLGTTTCSGELKFCNQGVCSAVPAEECGPRPLCLQGEDGTFPNPTDCSEYFECVRGNATLKRCPAGEVFSARTGSCNASESSFPCATINCGFQPRQAVAYPKDSRLFYYCSEEGVAYLFRCNGRDRFNAMSRRCEFGCSSTKDGEPETGDFPIEGTKTKFYRCIRYSTNSYQLLVQTCPRNQEFDVEARQCKESPPDSTTVSTTVLTTNSTTNSMPTTIELTEQTTVENI